MFPIISQVKREYFDWRTWNYIHRSMKKHTKKSESRKIEGNPNSIPYLNKPGITFSFDDSFRVNDWYTYGKDLFGFYDVKVSFNINAFHHYENEREHTQAEIDMLLDLQANGHEIAHHGFQHKNAVLYSKRVGIENWLEDEVNSLFNWMEKQSHSITGEKFKRPVTFVFPKFSYDDQTLKAIVPQYFKAARGHKMGNNLTPMEHTGFVPSICIDSHYLKNPKNIKRVLKFVKESEKNLILTCHSILPDNVEWDEFGWDMDEHAKNWRVSPNTIKYIIDEAKRIDLEFYTTSELTGVATFIDRNFEKHIRHLLSKKTDEWIFISELSEIKELNLSNIGMANLDGIQYFQDLQSLNLSDNNVSDFKLLDKLPHLKNLIIGEQSKNVSYISTN